MQTAGGDCGCDNATYSAQHRTFAQICQMSKIFVLSYNSPKVFLIIFCNLKILRLGCCQFQDSGLVKMAGIRNPRIVIISQPVSEVLTAGLLQA